MADQPPRGPTTPEDRPPGRRPRLHHVYYWLAGFDLLTVAVSLVILVWVVARYERSVRLNDFWADRMAEAWQLGALTSAVNAPGNDVFTTRDVDQQEVLLQRAVTAYEDHASTMRRELAGTDDIKGAADLRQDLDRVDEAVAAINARAREIFQHFREGRPDDAGSTMAVMDRMNAQATQTLAGLGDRVLGLQRANLQRQLREAHRARVLQFVLLGALALMVIAIAFYGEHLVRRLRVYNQALSASRDRLESLVEARTRELATSHEQLRSAERLASIGTLAAGLGHDMNNMLFPIRCRLDALSSGPGDAGLRRELEGVRGSIDYLQKLSDGLRMLAMHPDDPEAASGLTDLRAWSDEVGPLFRTALPKHAVLRLDFPAGLPRVALAPHELTQAVYNLVVNAGESISQEGLVRIWAKPDGESPFVRIAVSDDGAGMSEEVRRRALEPFFTTKTRGMSTGLGLAVVHGLISGAGGDVSIDSTAGLGTTVALRLPAVQSAAPATMAPRTAAVAIDDRRLETFVSALLGSAGFTVSRIGAGKLPAADLWVTQATPESLAAARTSADGENGRRIMVFGGEAEDWAAWRELGAVVVDGTGSLSSIQSAIRSIAGLSSGAPA